MHFFLLIENPRPLVLTPHTRFLSNAHCMIRAAKLSEVVADLKQLHFFGEHSFAW